MNARTTTRSLGMLTRTALLLGLLLNATMGWAQSTLYSENFGTTNAVLPTGWTSTNTTNGWNGSTSSVSGVYAGASAGANLFFAGTGTNGTVHTVTYANSLSTIGYTSITVLYGGRGTTTFASPITFQWSSDGTTWNTIAFTYTANGNAWALVNSGVRIALPAGAAGVSNLRFRWQCASTNSGNYRIDDFSVQGTAPQTIGTPVPTSLTGFTTTQGTPSTTQTFSITGSNLVANLVCAAQSTDFELREQGTATYSSSVSFTPSSGSVSRVLEVRLTGTTVGTPSSSVLCSSGTAGTQSVTVSGTVNPSGAPDCLGVVGGTALPGTGCDDNNVCTTGDVYSATCVCTGTFQDTDGDGTCNANDGCPSDPLKIAAGTCGCGILEPGTACNDGDACTDGDVVTSCGVCTGSPGPDSDGDGVCDATDGCLNDPAKTSPGLCGCGVPEVGSACNDNNACTINDVYVSCGVCAGTSPSAYWNMTTAASTTNSIPNVSMSSISRGNNNGTTTLITSTSPSSTSDYASASAGGNAGAAALTGALNPATNAYFEFTVTPTAGFGFTLNGISFGSRSTSTGPAAYTLRSSADGYTANIATGTLNTTGGYLFKTNTGLSASSSGSSAMTFRLFGHSGAGSPSANTANWRIDDLTITGCTALLPTYAFTVARAGAGSGTVTSSPAGINCGADCDETYVSGTVVTLTATPNAGSVFTGWSGGGCTGTGTCATTVSSATTVTASFDQDSDGDGLGDASDACQATSAVTGSPLFNAASCGANPGAYLSFTPVNSIQVRTSVSTCPAGSSCAGGDAPPVACAAGSFSSTTGASTCASCAASCGTGSVETQACTSTTDRVCDLDADNDGIPDTIDACQATAAVTGSPLFSAATCGANPGAYLTYTDVSGVQVATDITTCPAGSSCAGGTAPAVACPAGRFSDVTGSAVCQSCAAGFFSSTTGATQCTACAAGTFSDVLGSTQCTACAAGSFSSVTGSTSCTSCGAGTYNPTVGATECLSCNGTTNTPTGATSCTVADSDGDGIPDSSDPCQATSAVTGSALFSAATCGANPGAYLDYSDVSGVQVATAITTCPAGSSCAGGTAPAVACPAGRFSDVTGSAVCQSCAAGFFSSTTGATQCTACAAGKFSNTVGATECTSCAAGTYNPFSGAMECLTCTGGTDATTAAMVCLNYPGSPYCPVGSATPTLSGGSGGPYVCSNGQCANLVMNPATGEVDLAASAPGTYTICASGACVEMVIRSRPPVEPITGLAAGSSLCIGSPVQLSNATPGGAWSSSDPSVATVSSSGIAAGVVAGIVVARYTVSDGTCTNEASSSFSVSQSVSLNPPTVALSGGTNPTCSSSAVEFHATGTYSDGSAYDSDVSYAWSPDPITINGSGFLAVPSPSSGQVSVSVTSARACASTTPVSSSNSISLVVFPSLTILPGSLHIEQSLGSASTCSGSAMEFHLTGLYDDFSSATNDLSATWSDGVITIVGQNFGFSADASSSAVSASSVSSSRSCVSNNGSVAAPPDFALSVTESVSLSSVGLDLSSGTNPTCLSTPRAYTAFGTFSDGSTTDSRPLGETQYDFYLNGALVQSSSNPLYQDNGQQSNPLYVRVTSTRPCLSGSSSLDSPPVSLQVTATVDYAIDSDNDGYSVSGSTVSVCTDPGAPYRPVSVLVADGDCDDGDASVHPGATEVCDAGNVDEDCDGFVNEGSNVFFADTDGDTYGDASVSVSLVCTAPPSGFVSNSDDCDDSRASVHPFAAEVCDGRDDDCDGLVPSGETDDDGDGYVECAFSSATWGGSVLVFGGYDCNDADASIHPGATEVCDPADVDEDCDFSSTNGLIFVDYAVDSDNDNYFVSGSVVSECANPGAPYRPLSVLVADGDCDDGDASVHPGATETCDNQDEDCDGLVDEGDNVYFADSDGDGFGDALVSISRVCTAPPSGFVTNSGDCDDTRLLYADLDGDGIGAGAPAACGVQSNTDNCPNVTGQIGSSCNDNNACTTGDALNASCVCVGTFQDTDGDGVCNANDNCPNVTGQIGSSCNDGNTNTSNDVLNSSCVCTGTVVSNCDNWTLTFNLDASPAQTTWQIVDATTAAVVASGGPYAAPNSIQTITICLPQGACLKLIVNDSGNNGIAGGGWVLRDNTGKRIVDNVGNGGKFTSSCTTSTPFCNEPASTQTVISSNCDRENWLISDVINAAENTAVSAQWMVGNQTDDGYQFWFENPVGGYSRRIFRDHATSGGNSPANALRATKLKLNSMVTLPLPTSTLLNVRVRAKVNGVFFAWGPACRFKIDPLACNLTKLNDVVGDPNYSCGVTGKVVNASGNTGKLFAKVVTSGGYAATNYRFKFTQSAQGYARNITSTSATLLLSQWVTAPLLCGTYTYDVQVQASFDNGTTYCPYGDVCTVGITNSIAAHCTSPSTPFSGGNRAAMEAGMEFAMYPNPNDGDQLFITMSDVDVNITEVSLDVFDGFGKRVMSRTLTLQDGALNTALDLPADMASGLYVVNILAGDVTRTERLVIQH